MKFVAALRRSLDQVRARALNTLFGDADALAEEEAARAAARQALIKQAHLALLDGVKACTAGDNVGAMGAFQRAFIAFCQAEAKDDASLTQKVIGLLFIYIKDDDEVRRACATARAALEHAGMRDEAARILMFLGDFETDRKEYKKADLAYKTAVHLCRTIAYVDGEVDSLCRYGIAEARQGRPAEARHLMGQARAAAERHKRAELVEHVDAQADRVIGLAAPALMSGGGGGKGNRRF